MTNVKICGITNIADARFAESAGADSIGLNFYRQSARFVSQEIANEITASISSKVFKVGVFVNENITQILATAASSGLDAVQLHGDESSEFTNKLCDEAPEHLEIIKAIRITASFDNASLRDYAVKSILIDAYTSHAYGGTGEIACWDLARKVAESFRGRVYLAGGLHSGNVADAIQQVKPYAVDACSRLEIVPGRKDEKKVADFIAAAKGAI